MRLYIVSAVALLAVGCGAKAAPPTPSASPTPTVSQGERYLASAKEASAHGKFLEAGTDAELAVAYFQANGPKPSLIKARERAAESYRKSKQKSLALKQYEELARLVPSERRYKVAISALRDKEAPVASGSSEAEKHHLQRSQQQAAQAATESSPQDGQQLHDAAHMAGRFHSVAP